MYLFFALLNLFWVSFVDKYILSFIHYNFIFIIFYLFFETMRIFDSIFGAGITWFKYKRFIWFCLIIVEEIGFAGSIWYKVPKPLSIWFFFYEELCYIFEKSFIEYTINDSNLLLAFFWWNSDFMYFSLLSGMVLSFYFWCLFIPLITLFSENYSYYNLRERNYL